ncbi:MAG TPA: methyltransferase domain-containing protein [Solirubrobacteraceae bacterium]|nr:methyltransferase domain-containing protein [Solirubrobacteraceae bacterium]
MPAPDPETYRADSAEAWERAATGWGKRADRVREFGMPVSAWMIEHANLQPGQRVLELAAGPGDTGFLAAELIKPGGTLVTSDVAEAMLDVARERANAQGIDNVEFRQLQLEWIDLGTATIDTALCRWGIMLVADPEAAVREIRRVLKPGGTAAVAVWDEAAKNPWATMPGRALIALGHSEPPDPDAPGMFALAAPGRLAELLHSAGFVDPVVDSVEVERNYDTLESYLSETLDLSGIFARALGELTDEERERVREQIAALAEPYTRPDGSVRLTGRTLVAYATA